MLRHIIPFLLVFSLLSCESNSPEDIPKFKKRFRAQIASFEKEKEDADEKVEDGVSTLNGLEKALENAKNVDKEFERVYGKWERVDKQVNDLNREYEELKQDAENLFDAMGRQTASLSDDKTRNELEKALQKTRTDYEKTLANTQQAIEQLRGVHKEAVEVVKALEVAVGLGEIANINQGLTNIRERVAGIMTELNETVAESKVLYESRMGSI